MTMSYTQRMPREKHNTKSSDRFATLRIQSDRHPGVAVVSTTQSGDNHCRE
jgi:hypothetical protein